MTIKLTQNSAVLEHENCLLSLSGIFEIIKTHWLIDSNRSLIFNLCLLIVHSWLIIILFKVSWSLQIRNVCIEWICQILVSLVWFYASFSDICSTILSIFLTVWSQVFIWSCYIAMARCTLSDLLLHFINYFSVFFLLLLILLKYLLQYLFNYSDILK